jgi:NAD(P)-dependent dehydrogenase (short-subunit alcohol dehydrogenase family)
MRLKRQVVVVLNATKGNARSTARACAHRGATVHLVDDVDEKLVEQLAMECGRLGARAVFHGYNLRNGREDLARIADMVISREAVIDVLVCDSVDAERCQPFLSVMAAQTHESTFVVLHRGSAAIAQRVLGDLVRTGSTTVLVESGEDDPGVGRRVVQRLERGARGAA